MYDPISGKPTPAEHQPVTPDYTHNAVSSPPSLRTEVTPTIRPGRSCLFCRYRQVNPQSMEQNDA